MSDLELLRQWLQDEGLGQHTNVLDKFESEKDSYLQTSREKRVLELVRGREEEAVRILQEAFSPVNGAEEEVSSQGLDIVISWVRRQGADYDHSYAQQMAQRYGGMDFARELGVNSTDAYNLYYGNFGNSEEAVEALEAIKRGRN